MVQTHDQLARAELNPVQTLLEITGAYALPRCLHVVADLGVADVLDETPCTATDLADAVKADPDALGRVLRPSMTSEVMIAAEIQLSGVTTQPTRGCPRSSPETGTARAVRSATRRQVHASDVLVAAAALPIQARAHIQAEKRLYDELAKLSRRLAELEEHQERQSGSS